MTKEELLNAIEKIQNEYDAYMMMNRYSWEVGENDCAKEFKLLIDAKLSDEKAPNAIAWIHDCYDCYYKQEIENNEGNPFDYLRGVVREWN